VDHNVADIDFVTFSMYPDHWAYFAEWGEYANGSYVGTGVHNDSIDWWTNDTGITWRDDDLPWLGEGGYDNWVKQHTDWATINLSMPVVLQEAGMYTNHTKPLKDRYYAQLIDNFYNIPFNYYHYKIGHENHLQTDSYLQ